MLCGGDESEAGESLAGAHVGDGVEGVEKRCAMDMIADKQTGSRRERREGGECVDMESTIPGGGVAIERCDKFLLRLLQFRVVTLDASVASVVGNNVDSAYDKVAVLTVDCFEADPLLLRQASIAVHFMCLA